MQAGMFVDVHVCYAMLSWQVDDKAEPLLGQCQASRNMHFSRTLQLLEDGLRAALLTHTLRFNPCYQHRWKAAMSTILERPGSTGTS